MVISEFLKDVVHYKDMLSLAWTEIKTNRPVDFSVSLADLSENNEYYDNPWAIRYGYRKMVNNAIRMGTFLRRAKNRRQNTYWSPGTNGGIPMVKKADKIHEDTFRAHDIGHYMIPDLIYTGTDTLHHRRAYIAYRMISEATTMALADMLFVDALQKSGVEYDFDKRRIFPLFRDLKIDLSVHKEVENPEFLEKLRKVVHANYVYCLQGDNSVYRKLLEEAGSTEESLVRFQEKFMPFFVEDFRWTEHNYDNMIKRSEELSRWWKDIEPIRKFPDIFVESVDDFLCVLKGQDPEILHRDERHFVDKVFDVVFERNVRPVLLDDSPLPSKNVLTFRAFCRWLMGQLAITSKFHFLPESAAVREKIFSELLPHHGKDTFTLDHVARIRVDYENYLNFLSTCNFITKDDERTFAEVYPLFDPLYVSYDKDISQYEDLGDVSRRIFSMETHMGKKIAQAESAMSRTLSNSEKKYLSAMYRLVEAGDGQILNGIFVTRPGVLLLSHSAPSFGVSELPIPESRHLVTFLIAGVALETSLELIAHNEATIARLTSSKTQAMNVPLFRVQGPDTSAQQFLIREVLRVRTKFENLWKPHQNWNFDAGHQSLGTELFNMALPSTKTTCLCYSMQLSDFHKLFIGRMGPDGNEYDVRHVVRRMAEILHEKYPSTIQKPDVYLGLSNAAKLAATESLPTPASKEEGLSLVGTTAITFEGHNLLTDLNISTETPDFVQISEFRSRVTYLAFPSTPESSTGATGYVTKIVSGHGHSSILAACQVSFVLPESFVLNPVSGIAKHCLKSGGRFFLVATLKEVRALFLSLASEDPHYEILEKVRVIAEEQWKNILA
jgi:hypothetical protein